jgi:hypothetical protein
MSRRLTITELLNPGPMPSLATNTSPLLHLDSRTTSGLSTTSVNYRPPISSSIVTVTSTPLSAQYNVKMNRKTTLMKLYTYDLGSYVEYPESSAQGPIGHLFRLDPANWKNPALDFVYSRGEPSGRTKEGEVIYCRLLTDSNGTEVPCQERHTTCT